MALFILTDDRLFGNEETRYTVALLEGISEDFRTVGDGRNTHETDVLGRGVDVRNTIRGTTIMVESVCACRAVGGTIEHCVMEGIGGVTSRRAETCEIRQAVVRSPIDETGEVVGDEIGVGEVGSGHEGLLLAVDDGDSAVDDFGLRGELEDEPLQAVHICHERFKKRTEVVDGEEAVVNGVFRLENPRLTITIVGNGLRRQTDCVR